MKSMPERMWGSRVTPASAKAQERMKLEGQSLENGVGSSGKCLGARLQSAESCRSSIAQSSRGFDNASDVSSWEDLPELTLEMVVTNLVGEKPGWRERKVRISLLSQCCVVL